MKKGILALLIFLGVQLQAVKPTIFEDRDLGIVMEIPEELAKNWEISHIPTGTNLNIYQSEYENEKYYVLVLGKMPLTAFQCEESDCLYPFLFSQIQSAIGEDGLFDEEDFILEIIPLETKACSEVAIRSFRLRVTDVEEGMTMPIDIHSFYSEDHVLFLLTAVYPWMEEEQLSGFSEALIETIHPIKK